MNIQRLRNLTTGKLHTQMQDIYEDLEFITRGGGIMTHMIPRVMQAVKPWLQEQITDERFWDDQYDPSHVGDYPLREMSIEENEAAMKRYKTMPNPLENANKELI